MKDKPSPQDKETPEVSGLKTAGPEGEITAEERNFRGTITLEVSFSSHAFFTPVNGELIILFPNTGSS
ncbi:hypothetical protein YC2023_104283 [Brassica napus]